MFIHITLATVRGCIWFQKQKNVCLVLLMIFFVCNILVFRLLDHPLWCLLFSTFLQQRGSLYLTRAKLALLWFHPPTLPLRITSTWKVTSESQHPIRHLTRRRMVGTHISELRKALREKMCLRCAALRCAVPNYDELYFDKHSCKDGRAVNQKRFLWFCWVCLNLQRHRERNVDLHAPHTPLELLERVDHNILCPALTLQHWGKNTWLLQAH